MPGPLHLIRGLRKRARRIRRYPQITRILVAAERSSTCGALAAPSSRPTATAPGSRARSDSRSRMAASRSSKLGQILATRRDLLPAEFIDELSGLQDDAAQVSWLEVQQVLRSELGADVDDVFASFAGIDTVVAWDLDIVDRLARRLQRSTRWGGESARSTFLTGSRRRSGRNST